MSTAKEKERPWFDARTGMFLLDEYVSEMVSFKKIMADEVVTEEEIADQAKAVVRLLGELEKRLDPDSHELATQALCELSVLYAVSRYAELPRKK